MSEHPGSTPQYMHPTPVAGWDGSNFYTLKTNNLGELILGTSDNTSSVAVELTRTADANAYAIGDQIAATVTAASVTPLSWTAGRVVGGTGQITGARLVVDSATAFGAIRLHLFNTTPFAAGGFQADNAAIALTYTAMKTGSAGANPNYIGYIDFVTFTAQSASAEANGVCDLTQLAYACAAASQTIFGLLEARAAFTPKNAGLFDVILDIVQD